MMRWWACAKDEADSRNILGPFSSTIQRSPYHDGQGRAFRNRDRGYHMNDPKKAQESLRKTEELSRSVSTHESTISGVEREKSEKVRYYDQQISREKDEIKRLTQQSNEMKKKMDEVSRS